VAWANADPGAVLVEHSPVLTAAFDLSASAAVTGARLYPDTDGEWTSTNFPGTIVQGVLFTVTEPGFSLTGYWVWCCLTFMATTAPPLALWQATAFETGTLLPAGTVTGPTLVPGTWNFAPLAVPVPLTANTPYKAVYGLSGNFPLTFTWYGSHGPGSAGITNGPLLAYSAAGGTRPDPFNDDQCTFDTSTADPTAVYPITSNDDYNCWLDVQVEPS
jgi:hypothetical protein